MNRFCQTAILKLRTHKKNLVLFRFVSLTCKFIKRFCNLKGVCTQKDGDVHDKFNFLEIQELRPLKTCQKHFETIFPNFLLDECGI